MQGNNENQEILTDSEKQILLEVYQFSNPEAIVTGPDNQEKRELYNVLKILREDTDTLCVAHQPNENTKHFEALVLAKVEKEGIRALNDRERSCYKLYLLSHINKTNVKGEAIKPIHVNVADLVLLEKRVFVLNQDAYIYNENNGTYEKDLDGKVIKEIIKKFLDREFIEDKIVNSIYNLVISDSRLAITDSQINQRPKEWIHFKNGYYDPTCDSMKEHNPRYYEIGVIPWEYTPSRFPSMYKLVQRGSGILRETIDKPLAFNEWLDQAIPDKEDQTMFFQYLGYTMSLATGKQKFLMICGPGGTGKSTLLSVVEAIIGKANISNISLQGLQERFSPGELYLKQANICADIPLSALSEVDMIKKLTGEDTISADRKFKSNFSFRSYARLFFSANDIPVNLSDRTNAFYRRMLILKMDYKPEVVDSDLLDKLKDEIPNIITRVVEEYYCSCGNIDESSNSREYVKMAHKNSDTVEAFIDDRCEINTESRINRTSLYREYCNYCDNEGRKYLTQNGFYKALEAKGYKQIKGSTRDFLGLQMSNIISLTGAKVV